jgi:hypothetical protein
MIRYSKIDYSSGVRTETEVVEHVGRTVYAAWGTVQVMSDIWETWLQVYSIDKDGHMSVRAVRGDGFRNDNWTIDANDEAFADLYDQAVSNRLDRLVNEFNRSARVPTKGRTVKVTRGRTACNTVGTIVAVIEGTYNAGWRSRVEQKLGIATSDRTTVVVKGNREYVRHLDVVWVWARNCEVVNVEEPNMVELEQFAKEFGAQCVAQQRSNMEKSLREFPEYSGNVVKAAA